MLAALNGPYFFRKCISCPSKETVNLFSFIIASQKTNPSQY
jgi:hypothetical protein